MGWAIVAFILLAFLALTNFIPIRLSFKTHEQAGAIVQMPDDYESLKADLSHWKNGPGPESLASYIDRLTKIKNLIDLKANPMELQAINALLKQSKACQAISHISLEDILAEATRSPTNFDFQKNDGDNRWMFVWDARVVPDASNGCVINDYRMIGSGVQAQIKLGSQQSLSQGLPPEGRRMVFVIQLKGINVKVSGWETVFENESAVLIEDICFLDWLGIPQDTEIIEVLNRQKNRTINPEK